VWPKKAVEMRWLLQLGVFLFFSFSYSQGLNGELSFNQDYSQRARAIVAFDDYSIFVKEQSESASFFTRSSLVKIDTSENLLWEIPVQPQGAEVVQITEMIASENSGLYVLGYARPTCDIAGGCFWFLSKYDSNGTIEWGQTWQDQVCFGVSMSGLSLSQNNRVLVHYSDPVTSAIYTFNTNGGTITTINPNQSGFQGIDQLSGFNCVAFKQFSLFGFDGSGGTSQFLTFSSFIRDAQVWNDTLYIATEDSLFVLDNTFQTLHANEIQGMGNFSNLKLRNQDIRIVSSNANQFHLFTLDRNLQVISEIILPNSSTSTAHSDYTNTHFAVASDFNLSEYFAVRHLDYSLVSQESVEVNWTDIGIQEIQITQSSANLLTNFQNVFQVEIAADVLLKNHGIKPLESCRINHYISPALACGLIYYGENFFNLNLAPGDSMWISLGTIHTATRAFPSDSLVQEICVYTSHPNTKTDLNIQNDRHCTTVALGTAHLETTIPSEITRIKVLDMLGRETKVVPNQWLLYIYDDGSSERVFLFEE
jgi:hypothetical protein